MAKRVLDPGVIARRRLAALQLLLTAALLAAVAFGSSGGAATRGESAVVKQKPRKPAPRGIHKIKHVIVIMQENRSFDSYFGTYPGADGIPTGVCVPDPRGGCVRPYHNSRDRNVGG